MNRLARLITEASVHHAGRTAVIHGDRRVPFSEIEALSNRLASALTGSFDLVRGDRVAILLPNCPEYVAIDFALIKAGLVRVPVNPRLAPPEIEFVLSDSGSRVVVYGPEHASTIETLEDRVPTIEHFVKLGEKVEAPTVGLGEVAEGGSEAPFEIPTRDEDDYMILYTSGTTGRPKGALTSVRSRWVTLFHVYANEDFVHSEDVMLHVASLAHGSGTKVLPHYVKGAKNLFLPRFTVEEFCRAVQEHRVTTTWLVPTLVGMLLDFRDRGRYDLSSLRTIVYAGAPMPVERLQEALEVFGPVFVQVYGLSEAPQPDLVLSKNDHAAGGSPDADVRARLGSAGRRALGAQVRVVAEDGSDVAPGGIGEIILSGEHVMTRYWNRPDATAEVMRDGWFHTGDLARVDEAGYVFIVDRVKDMIISGGYNVYPREVEEVLYAHPAIREAAVFGVPDDKWGEAVSAAVSLRPGEEVSEDELIEHCRAHLASYKKPRKLAFMDDLPKSATGKILKKVLRAPHWEGRSRKV